MHALLQDCPRAAPLFAAGCRCPCKGFSPLCKREKHLRIDMHRGCSYQPHFKELPYQSHKIGLLVQLPRGSLCLCRKAEEQAYNQIGVSVCMVITLGLGCAPGSFAGWLEALKDRSRCMFWARRGLAARASHRAAACVEQALQASQNGLEAGPLGRVLGPALLHKAQVVCRHVYRHIGLVPGKYFEQDLQWTPYTSGRAQQLPCMP